MKSAPGSANPILVPVTLILFFTREIVSHSTIGKLITMLSGVLLFLFGSFLVGSDVRVDNPKDGWTALPPGIDPGDLRQIFSYNIKPSIMVSQIILLFAMVYIAYKWGTMRVVADQKRNN